MWKNLAPRIVGNTVEFYTSRPYARVVFSGDMGAAVAVANAPEDIIDLLREVERLKAREHSLETNCDPAGNLQLIADLTEQRDALALKLVDAGYIPLAVETVRAHERAECVAFLRENGWDTQADALEEQRETRMSTGTHTGAKVYTPHGLDALILTLGRMREELGGDAPVAIEFRIDHQLGDRYRMEDGTKAFLPKSPLEAVSVRDGKVFLFGSEV